VFLRKIIKGGADRSYGIQVARLAGVPERVLVRAREICDFLIDSDIASKARNIEAKIYDKAESGETSDKKTSGGKKGTGKNGYEQLSMFTSPEEITIANELKSLDLNNMTPMKAMLYLQELKERLNG
ncbi:MAG: DNA mismatch repair protein MutS, partial [Lachnospiraceae bacterium]|nr:DNA mismatch repair protein MutS [Lachnospiraceae bacterium]